MQPLDNLHPWHQDMGTCHKSREKLYPKGMEPYLFRQYTIFNIPERFQPGPPWQQAIRGFKLIQVKLRVKTRLIRYTKLTRVNCIFLTLISS